MTDFLDSRLSPVDLERCATEPIHVPGAIQPHGHLLACSEPDLLLRHASAELGPLLGQPLAGLLGRALEDVLGTDAAAAVRAALMDLPAGQTCVAKIKVATRAFDATVHRWDGLAIVELEDPAGDRLDAGLLNRVLARLRTARTLTALQQAAVTGLREMTGFDRVMLYRFHPDEHGEVVAEAKADDIEPFLGLHYPASDIPRQARQLYRMNWLRVIPDASYEPVALEPPLRPDTGAPVDLSHSVLRSVSPVHREYLRNMGLRASMSISLLQEERLWGLVTCGHRTPRRLSVEDRQACEAVGRMLSLSIGACETVENRQRRAAKAEVVAGVCAGMRMCNENAWQAMMRWPQDLLSLLSADGVAALVDGHVVRYGRCPGADTLRRLGQWVHADAFSEEPLQLTRLQGSWPAAADAADGTGGCCGLLAITLPRPEANALMWFRPEVGSTVNWAGDPSKSAQPGSGAPEGILRPRTSFALWKEQVRGHSAPWRDDEVWVASELRRCAVEHDLERQVRLAAAAMAARERTLAAVSHDLVNPVSAVLMNTTLVQRVVRQGAQLSSESVATALDGILYAANRMKVLLGDLRDFGKLEGGEFDARPQAVDVGPLLQDVCQMHRPMATGQGQALSCSAEPGLVAHADPECLFRVLTNLIGNAIKFSPPGGLVRVSAVRHGASVRFDVKDTGRGIAADQLPHVFELHWQHEETAAQGSGLGLYIARGIVEAHGGRIWASSEPGRGSVFSFTLPLGMPLPASGPGAAP